mmetsp:Transcript_25166/g.100171  ORF Transcript_25166/g.100171 Transcript_25166/m.100171 type:complete len:257 (+) Transcript_25166:1135-1905(+)
MSAVSTSPCAISWATLQCRRRRSRRRGAPARRRGLLRSGSSRPRRWRGLRGSPLRRGGDVMSVGRRGLGCSVRRAAAIDAVFEGFLELGVGGVEAERVPEGGGGVLVAAERFEDRASPEVGLGPRRVELDAGVGVAERGVEERPSSRGVVVVLVRRHREPRGAPVRDEDLGRRIQCDGRVVLAERAARVAGREQPVPALLALQRLGHRGSRRWVLLCRGPCRRRRRRRLGGCCCLWTHCCRRLLAGGVVVVGGGCS